MVFSIYGSSGPIKQYHTAHSSPIRGNSLVTESIYGIESSSSNLPPVKLTSPGSNQANKISNPFIDSSNNTFDGTPLPRKDFIRIINENCLPRLSGSLPPTPSKVKRGGQLYRSDSLHVIQSSPPSINKADNNETGIEIEKDFLTFDYENQDDILKAEEVYRNLYGISPNESTSSSKMTGISLCSRSLIAYNLFATPCQNNTKECGDSDDHLLLLEILNQKLKSKQSQSLLIIKLDPQSLNPPDKNVNVSSKPLRLSICNNSFVSSSASLANTDSDNYKHSRIIEPPKTKSYPSSQDGNFIVKLKLQADSLVSKQETTNYNNKKLSPAPSIADSSSEVSSDNEYIPEKRVTRNNKRKLRPVGVSVSQHEKKRKLGARSKTGCWTCRIRHKACPEEKPSCSQCIRLQLDCDYSDKRPSYMSDPNLQIQKLKEIRAITNQNKRANFLSSKGKAGLRTSNTQ